MAKLKNIEELRAIRKKLTDSGQVEMASMLPSDEDYIRYLEYANLSIPPSKEEIERKTREFSDAKKEITESTGEVKKLMTNAFSQLKGIFTVTKTEYGLVCGSRARMDLLQGGQVLIEWGDKAKGEEFINTTPKK